MWETPSRCAFRLEKSCFHICLLEGSRSRGCCRRRAHLRFFHGNERLLLLLDQEIAVWMFLQAWPPIRHLQHPFRFAKLVGSSVEEVQQGLWVARCRRSLVWIIDGQRSEVAALVDLDVDWSSLRRSGDSLPRRFGVRHNFERVVEFDDSDAGCSAGRIYHVWSCVERAFPPAKKNPGWKIFPGPCCHGYQSRSVGHGERTCNICFLHSYISKHADFHFHICSCFVLSRVSGRTVTAFGFIKTSGLFAEFGTVTAHHPNFDPIDAHLPIVPLTAESKFGCLSV